MGCHSFRSTFRGTNGAEVSKRRAPSRSAPSWHREVHPAHNAKCKVKCTGKYAIVAKCAPIAARLNARSSARASTRLSHSALQSPPA